MLFNTYLGHVHTVLNFSRAFSNFVKTLLDFFWKALKTKIFHRIIVVQHTIEFLKIKFYKIRENVNLLFSPENLAPCTSAFGVHVYHMRDHDTHTLVYQNKPNERYNISYACASYARP